MSANDKALEDLTEAERKALAQAPEMRSMSKLFERVGAYEGEARALFGAIRGMGYTRALRHIEENPPSPGCIALLAHVGYASLARDVASKKAEKANAPKAQARAWMLEKWKRDGHAYPSKTKFAETYRDMLKRECGEEVTIKTIVERWLKGL